VVALAVLVVPGVVIAASFGPDHLASGMRCAGIGWGCTLEREVAIATVMAAWSLPLMLAGVLLAMGRGDPLIVSGVAIGAATLLSAAAWVGNLREIPPPEDPRPVTYATAIAANPAATSRTSLG
jgi:ABC-type phosphate transport system permease subunit